MKRKFGTDYVYFDKYLSFDRIKKGYVELVEKLNINISKEISLFRETADALMKKVKPMFKGKSFIYGNTPMLAFELNSFLCQMGMVPILIMTRGLYTNDDI
ncbi:MAG: hypothetical protein JJT76_10405 [Clostridiaceae bacterium]|nr:hypothetical protein [Clostridiaceae bacterium]